MRKIISLAFISILIMGLSFSAENEELEVEIGFPNFDIILNGTVVENSEEVYPFITYNNITYVPMTWDLSLSLGLELSWSQAEGLKINKSDAMSIFEFAGGGDNNIFKKYKAKIVTGVVTVNGRVIDNSKEVYPLLNFRDITYFPMTYDFMVKEFESGYKWNGEKGLSVSADESLQVKLPKEKVFESTVDIETLLEKQFFASEHFEIKYVAEVGKLMIGAKRETSSLFKNHIYDLEFDYYDENNEYIYSEIIIKGLKDGDFTTGQTLYYSETASSIVVKESFTSLRAAKYISSTSDIEIEYVKTKDITIEKIKSDKASYFDNSSFGVYEDIDVYTKEELEYVLLKHTTRHYLKDGKSVLILIHNGVKEVRDYSEILKDLKETQTMRIEKEDDGSQLMYLDIGNGESYQGFANVIRLFDDNEELFKIYVNVEE